MNNNCKLPLLVIISLGISILSCSRNPLEIDVSKINLQLDIKRLDQDLFAIHPDSLQFFHPELEQKYGDFLNLYTNLMIHVGDPSKITYYDYLKTFTSDYVIVKIHEETKTKFGDIEWLKEDLSQAFRHYKYYFPNKPVPSVYTCISGFNQSVVSSDSLLGISLDKYLGRECPLYKRLDAPAYLKLRMADYNIPTDCLLAWANMEFPYNDSVDNLLSRIIYKGKIQYFIDAMFPQMEDSLKMGYSAKQWKWAQKYEELMWKYFVEKKLLFNDSRLEIQKYTEIGPFTNSFGPNSPDRTGVWIGWKIVKSYMKNHPEMRLPDLMKNDDYQSILTLSRYKP